MSSATLGSTDIQLISPSQIERIEVIKGPRAAIWGSDAVGGVIQIFTRKQEGLAVSVNVGSDNYQQINAIVGFEHGDGASSIAINSEKSDGFDVLENVEPDDDGYKNLSITAVGNQMLTDQLNVNYLLQLTEADVEYDSATWNNQSTKENHIFAIGADYASSDAHQLSIKLSQAQNSSLDFGVSDDLYETVRNQASVVSANQVSDNLSVTGGIDFQQEKITTSSSYTEDSRNIFALFGHGQYQQEKYKFELAVRHDDVDNIDAETTFNVGVGYDLSRFSTIAFSHGTGFKTPTFNDLYYPYGGNEELVSETSSTSEFLYKHNFLMAVAQASIYQTEIDNLIAWAPIEPGSFVWMPFNVNAAEVTGAEFDLQANYLGYKHDLSFSYIDTEDKATGEQLLRRAKTHFNYSISTSLKDLDLRLSYSYKGKRMDVSKELKAYSLMNANLAYHVSPPISVNFKVNKLLDEEYMTAENYNTQGHTFYLGVRYQQ